MVEGRPCYSDWTQKNPNSESTQRALLSPRLEREARYFAPTYMQKQNWRAYTSVLCSIFRSRTEIGSPLSLERVYENGRKGKSQNLIWPCSCRLERKDGSLENICPKKTRERADLERKFPYSSIRTNNHNFLGSLLWVVFVNVESLRARAHLPSLETLYSLSL